MYVLWKKSLLVWCVYMSSASYKKSTETKENLFLSNITGSALLNELTAVSSGFLENTSDKCTYREPNKPNPRKQDTMTLLEIVTNINEYKVYRFTDRNVVYITLVPGLVTIL